MDKIDLVLNDVLPIYRNENFDSLKQATPLDDLRHPIISMLSNLEYIKHQRLCLLIAPRCRLTHLRLSR